MGTSRRDKEHPSIGLVSCQSRQNGAALRPDEFVEDAIVDGTIGVRSSSGIGQEEENMQ